MSPIIYHVTIDALEKENVFRINWIDRENTVHTFEQSASAIAPEEMEWMWKDRRNQLKIGEKLSYFLDGDDHHLQRALKDADKYSETLQLNITNCRETANWPFELLALQGSFLLPNRMHPVRHAPVRETVKESPPENRRLRLLFMACSPLDVPVELDFEKEEEGIFKAAEKLAIDMEVEDTGSLAGLREKLEQQTYDIVHLSGYAGIDKKGQPFFVMESETGNREEVPVEKLWQEGLRVNPPRLLFLSGSSTGDAPGEIENVFARILVEKYHIAAVLGWGRWISDNEANEAASMIYKELSRGETLLHAVQRARYELFNNYPSILKPSWPQLRLFSNGGSLDAIVEKEQKEQPQVRRMTHVYLRNSDVKVLGEGFVGRRRQLQQSIRILKLDREKVGLLILGTGGLGKSCLAGKVSERFKEHTLISVHGRLNSITLKRALKDAFVVSQDEHGKDVLAWEMEMKDIVGVLCRSCFKERPYLILLDDFEQNLEGWEKGEPGGLLPEAAELMKALLDNLPDSEKMTRMIITSRYGFSMHQELLQTSNGIKDAAFRTIKSFSGGQGGPHGVGSLLGFFKKVPLDKADLVNEKLELIWLVGFREVEQKKKVRALPHISKQTEPTIVDKLLAAGCGNPRLMEWIDIVIGELEIAKTGVTELLQAVSGKKQEFIQKHVINELLELGGEELTVFLRWFAIYRRPVLKEGAKEVGEKAGLQAWENLLYRGLDLSLVEHDEARLSYQGTPLLREELLSKLDDHRPCHEAAFVYYKSICEGKADEQFDPVQTEEWIFHALGCGEEEVASFEGSNLIKYLRENLALSESRLVGAWILEKKKCEFMNEEDVFLLNSLSITMTDLGEYQKAIIYFKKALTINEALCGREHPNVANCFNNLGEVWIRRGKPKQAIYYYRKALTIYKVVFGQKHPSIGTALNNLGLAWYDLSNPKKAVNFHQKALKIFEIAYGHEHPDIAISLNNLGMASEALGEYRKAINYFQEALCIHETMYGREHPDVATNLNNIGMAWQYLGDHSKAIIYYQEALAINKCMYGQVHPNIATGLNNLGMAWHSMGDYRKTIDYFGEALSINEEVFGPKHPNIATGLNNLGMVWHDLGDFNKALDYFTKAFIIDERAFGDKHSRISRDLNNLGLVYQDLGEFHKAISYFQKSLDISKMLFGREHPNISRDLNNIGSAWDNLGDNRKAIYYYQDALSIDEAVFGPKHPNVAIELNNLGMAWLALGDPGQATEYFKQALDINKIVFGSEHPAVATGLNNLGLALDDLGDHKGAIKYYDEALIIDKAVFGQNHSRVATELNNLSTAWNALDHHSKAIDYCRQALDIDDALYGRNHPNTARDLSNLGVIYFKLGQLGKAKIHFEEAYEIYNKFFGPGHPNTKKTAEWLEKLGDGNKTGQAEFSPP